MSRGLATAAAPTRLDRWRLLLAVAVVVQLAASLLVVGVDRAGDATSSSVLSATGADTTSTGLPGAGTATDLAARDLASALGAGRAPGLPPDQGAAPVPAPLPVEVPDPVPAVQEAAPLVVPDPGAAPAPEEQTKDGAPSVPTTFGASAPVSAAASQSEQIFAREHPTHAAARQRADVPSSFHWAVIIGVNDYMGRTTNTIGSVSDALTLRDTLYRHGWRGDQVLTLTDHAATHDQIVRAIEWLIRSTDQHSTVVFSFSGHMRHDSGVTALWPADNRFIWAGDLGRMLGAVRADRMWVTLQGCHAAGLAAPGLEGANRLVTYASRVPEKAYEDPAIGYSVMGYYLFAEGLRDARGTQGGADRVTAQEAFAWAAPLATWRTSGQSHGAQRPVMVDGLGGRQFPIAVTGAPPPPAATRSAPAPAPEEREGRTRGLLRSLGLPDPRVGLP